MPTTWVVVAHRAGARIYENHGPGKGLKMVQEIPHPEGRLQNQEINTDRPGRAFDSGGPGSRHGMSEQVSATEHVADVWAKHLAETLETARTQNRFERLVLVAEPGFLGVLQHTLRKPTSDLLVGTVKKDLAHAGHQDVAAQVGEVIAV
jgi:protein required for attachment to host cells